MQAKIYNYLLLLHFYLVYSSGIIAAHTSGCRGYNFLSCSTLYGSRPHQPSVPGSMEAFPQILLFCGIS